MHKKHHPHEIHAHLRAEREEVPPHLREGRMMRRHDCHGPHCRRETYERPPHEVLEEQMQKFDERLRRIEEAIVR